MIRDLVLMKLNAVGLRGARTLMPAELSGGMARRVALARAIALDPMLIMYDEPFTGLDPISLGVIGNLIRKLNDALGATRILVTHDVEELVQIVDYVYFVSTGRIVAQGTPDEMRASTSRSCTSSSTARSRPGAVPLPGTQRCATTSGWSGPVIGALDRGVRADRPQVCRTASGGSGYATRFFFCCSRSGTSFRRFQLTLRRDLLHRRALADHHRRVRACSSAWCWACRATKRCKRTVPRKPLGVLVALVSGARARAGGRGAAVRQPRRLGDHRRDRPHEGHRAALGDGDDGGGSDCARGGAAVLGGRDLDAAAGGDLQCHGRVRRLPHRRRGDRRGRGAFWSQMQAPWTCERMS